MTIQIYNVLTRQKEPFEPINKGKVNIYVCGPTVYDYPHIGHAKTYIAFDVVVRFLKYMGYDVLYVQNITDVGHLLDSGEDRILKKARTSSVKPMQIVETYTKLYFDNMDALGVQRPNISPRASAHVPEQIKMTQTLIDTGFAYEVNGSVYFDVLKSREYGKLSGRKVDELDEGARVAIRSEKRHPADFALWKFAEPEHLLRWDSPWGEGFPGWHIECSAMARKYLGDNFDIHGGGIDNIFPHNECEIAQSEAANESPFANYWMLTGSLTLDSVKMSKSLGNTLTINDALERWRPEAIRTFVLSAHYTSPIDFSDDAIDAAYKGWQRLWSAVTLLRQQMDKAPEGEVDNDVAQMVANTKADFVAKMSDDFNMPASLAVLQEFTHKVNSLLNDGIEHNRATLEAIDTLYRELGSDVLGIIPNNIEGSGNMERESKLVELLLDIRQQARKNKDWATSDKIRDSLKEAGVVVEDRADGSMWKVVN